MNNSNTVISRVFTVATVAILVFALNVSGALAGFWRTLDGATSNGVPNPAQFLFGEGSDGQNTGLFGYGFGFGYGTFSAGYGLAGYTTTSSSSSSSSSSSGWGGGGWGGWSIDRCPNWDTSGSLRDGKCSPDSSSSSSGGTTTTSSSSSSSGGTTTTGFERKTYPDAPRIETCGVSIVTFNDIAGNTFEQHIKNLEAISGLNGNGNGSNFAIYQEESKSFQPNRAATRSEYIKMVFRALCIDYSAMNSTLDDFADGYVDPWQAKVFNLAVDYGWVSGTNTYARVNDPISRAEALKIIMQAGIASAITTPASSSFSDVSASSWEARYTENALSWGIIAGNPTFRPADAVTRGESTKLIMNTLY